MSNFLDSLRISESDTNTLVDMGIMSPADFGDLDNEIVDSADILPIAKARLKKYIAWRDATLVPPVPDIRYVQVDLNTLRAFSPPAPAATAPSLDAQALSAIIQPLADQRAEDRRLSTLQTDTMSNIADRLQQDEESRDFREGFKNNKDFPPFNGQITSWSTWKRKFTGFLGANNLDSLLRPPVQDEDDDTYDPRDNQKYEWLYHSFQQHVHKNVLTFCGEIPRDDNNKIIPDGQEAWTRI